MRREGNDQTPALLVREITEKYWAPLGVWVVRVAAREALRNPPRKFETLVEALADMATRIRTPSRDWRPRPASPALLWTHRIATLALLVVY